MALYFLIHNMDITVIQVSVRCFQRVPFLASPFPFRDASFASRVLVEISLSHCPPSVKKTFQVFTLLHLLDSDIFS